MVDDVTEKAHDASLDLDAVLSNGLTLREINSAPADEASFNFPPNLPPAMRKGLLETNRRYLEALRRGGSISTCLQVSEILEGYGFKKIYGRFVTKGIGDHPGYTKSHVWPEHKGVIYDITAAQFNHRMAEEDQLKVGLNIARPGTPLFACYQPKPEYMPLGRRIAGWARQQKAKIVSRRS